MSIGFWSRSLGPCLRPLANRLHAPCSPLHVRGLATQAARIQKPANVIWGAVHKEMATRNPAGAIDIVNAALISDPRIRTPPDLVSSMQFQASVRSRLPFHALVHGLIRADMPFAAAEQVHARMVEGAKIRMATMNAVLEGLIVTDGGPTEREYSVMGASAVFALHSARIQSEFPKLSHGTRTAIQLMRSARRTRNNRDNKMYERLIDACLLQGEIVVGTLLFVLLVRDWQLRRALNRGKAPPSTTPHGDVAIDGKPLQDAHIRAAREIGLDNWSVRIPQPKPYMLQRLLSHIIFPGAGQSATFRPPPHWKPPDKQQVVAMKRALFLLAELLDNRQLEMDCLVSLVKVMSNVPRFPPLMIPTTLDGSPALHDVYEYCHDAIWRFSQTLPDHYVVPTRDTPSMIKPVSTRTYNVLLNYVLLHRMDVDAAHRLLEHMCTQRDPPVMPTLVTVNTIMRRASLLRRNDVVDKALQLFRTLPVDDPVLRSILETRPPPEAPAPRNPWHLPADKSKKTTKKTASPPSSRKIVATARVSLPAALDVPAVAVQSEVDDSAVVVAAAPAIVEPVGATAAAPPEHAFAHALDKLAVDQLSFPEQIQPGAFETADAFTLSSYIAHLTSTNQIDRVVELLFALLPQLDSVPVEGVQRLSVRRRLWGARTRGSKLGRYFFSVVINALRKAGKTGLTERVWYLARLAEEASWDLDPAVSGGVDPWCLDITAYTAMLQCYAMESRKGATLAARTDKRLVIGWGYYNWLRGTEEVWDVADDGRAFGRWGPRDKRRAIAGRELGMLLVQSMRSRAGLLWRAFANSSARAHPQAPGVDARFFNAMLDIYSRQPLMVPRRPRAYRQRWERKHERAVRRHVGNGWLTPSRDPMVLTIAEEMAKHGLQLPLGLRQVTLGRNLHLAHALPTPVRPRRYPNNRNRAFRPFALEVTKDKGLPIAREPKRWQVIKDDWGSRFERPRTAVI